MNSDDPRYSDPDYDRDGSLIGEEVDLDGYDAAVEENWYQEEVALPIVPTQWDVMLGANGWTEEQAIASPVAKALARKLLLNRKYIPEVVLMAWGRTEW